MYVCMETTSYYSGASDTKAGKLALSAFKQGIELWTKSVKVRSECLHRAISPSLLDVYTSPYIYYFTTQLKKAWNRYGEPDEWPWDWTIDDHVSDCIN